MVALLLGMARAVVAGAGREGLDPGGDPLPSRCPYCAVGGVPHWTRNGYYWRYAGDEAAPNRKIAIARWWCKIYQRTFSLLPDALLPRCSRQTGQVLTWLGRLWVDGVGLNTLARQLQVARGTLRGLQRRFRRVVSLLRLPSQEAALPPARFLQRLTALPRPTMLGLFRQWKEREPKHSIVGIYRR